ncbi:protein-L-isoaspartate(D-aspartate) O-methyltransferase [Streptomyces sp. NPDC050617]|uniref:protein-L-isoaspartate(D-aspartate) O-methyltransferase n=1 Tax=Streptomyces sp. NPDC050617 TaxID=3154628 RepID=UPI00342EBCED
MTLPDWKPHAERLAAEVTHPQSRWRPAVASTPRHVFVPRWWGDGADGRTLGDGASDPERWMRVAYSNTSLVTRVGPRHADHAEPGEKADGLPTSSSTLPWLVVRMYQHAKIADASRVLVTAGSGYGTALACRRLADRQVTSIDVDPYLVAAAAERLATIGLRPTVRVCDITGPLPGTYDRIVSTVSLPSVPASLLAALNPGGRLVTTLAGTGLVLTADKTEDGGAVGQIECEGAGFMSARHGEDYPPDLFDVVGGFAEKGDGEESVSPYPVVNVQQAWELWSTFSLEVPGVEHRFRQDDGCGTAWMAHLDGSWAKASAMRDEPARVIQGGPRRLWDELDRIRHRWLVDGRLNTYGARASITPDGVLTLSRGEWSVSVG